MNRRTVGFMLKLLTVTALLLAVTAGPVVAQAGPTGGTCTVKCGQRHAQQPVKPLKHPKPVLR